MLVSTVVLHKNRYDNYEAPGNVNWILKEMTFETVLWKYIATDKALFSSEKC